MTDTSDLYERDFVRWSEEQAAALRSASQSRTNLPLDWEHLAEEIDSLGRSLRSELRNRLAVVIEHLLKLHLSPAVEPRSGWAETIGRERVEIESLLDENPSLRASLSDALAAADNKGRRLAQIGLEHHDEWSAAVARALAELRFREEDVLGSWLPTDRPRP